MNEEDKKLLKAYMKGFNDYSVDIPKFKYFNQRMQKAYNLGVQHFIIGDDVRSVDYLSDEQILKLIKE